MIGGISSFMNGGRSNPHPNYHAMPTEINYPYAPSICQVCYLRPTSGGTEYCSKTCAAAVTYSKPTSSSSSRNLCKYCRAKPKYDKYEYCGKTCAEKAAAAASSHSHSQSRSHHGRSRSESKSHSVTPLRIQVPSTQDRDQKMHMFGPLGDLVATVAKVVSRQDNDKESGSESEDDSGVPRCMLPKCKQRVHVDKNGRITSEYCSQSHREKAVDSGLASPCVMCLSNPQRASDHFCGRACKEEALTKRR
ncbi:hypothetical protein BXZ70DRAFT_447836 [Cristinia sonorae]|uniref:Uncharacterized protein n=1 Tax=Cristinia sonorae TaxID=1940300 RepID=A0A8K0XMQ0_9AGAR|nr:hypothetical protein BXZ70DRAFT_447836 [Cristinia sonorae]